VAGRGTPARGGGSDGVELEGEGVDATPELVDPPLNLARLAPELVQARAQARLAPLDLGERLGRPAIGRLDLGLEGGPTALDLLLDPQQVSAKPVEILAEEGGGFRSAPCEQGNRSEDCCQPAPRPPRRHSVVTA
jgi:hypothetical protein